MWKLIILLSFFIFRGSAIYVFFLLFFKRLSFLASLPICKNVNTTFLSTARALKRWRALENYTHILIPFFSSRELKINFFHLFSSLPLSLSLTHSFFRLTWDSNISTMKSRRRKKEQLDEEWIFFHFKHQKSIFITFSSFLLWAMWERERLRQQ